MDTTSLGSRFHREAYGVVSPCIVALVGLIGLGFAGASLTLGLSSWADWRNLVLGLPLGVGSFWVVWRMVLSHTDVHEDGVFKRDLFDLKHWRKGGFILSWDEVREVSVRYATTAHWSGRNLITGEQDLELSLVFSDGKDRTVSLGAASYGRENLDSRPITTLKDNLNLRVLNLLRADYAAGRVAFGGFVVESGRLRGIPPRALIEQAVKESVLPTSDNPVELLKRGAVDLSLQESSTAVRINRGWAYMMRGPELLFILPSSTPNLMPSLVLLSEISNWTIE